MLNEVRLIQQYQHTYNTSTTQTLHTKTNATQENIKKEPLQ
jgi:hypothetical protein